MNKKVGKIIALVLTCLLLIGAAVGITVMANEGGESTSVTKVEIHKKNISYNSVAQMMYTVEVTGNLAEKQTIKMVFSDKEISVAVNENISDLKGVTVKDQSGTATIGNDATKYPLFFSPGVYAKEMRVDLYAAPVLVNEDGSIAYVGESVNFTPYDYAMTRFGGNYAKDQFNLYKALLDYGGAVQAVLGYKENGGDKDISLLNGWIDAYYDVTVNGSGEGYKGVRADEVNTLLVADRLNKDFVGFFDGNDQVFEFGKDATSATWYQYTILPGTHDYTIKYSEGAAKYETFDTADELPNFVSLNGISYETPYSGDVQKDGKFAYVMDGSLGIYRQNSHGNGSVYFQAPTTNAITASYEFDLTYLYANNGRYDGGKGSPLIIKIYALQDTPTNSDVINSPYTGSIYQQTTWGENVYTSTDYSVLLSTMVGTINQGDTKNIRVEFTKTNDGLGYYVGIYNSGKLVLKELVKLDDALGTPLLCIDLRYTTSTHANTNLPGTGEDGKSLGTNDIRFNLDNLRCDYTVCDEHNKDGRSDWAIFNVVKAACGVAPEYNSFCTTCGYIHTAAEDRWVGEMTIDHTLVREPSALTMATTATATSPATYYEICSNCKFVNTAGVTYGYGKVDRFASGMITGDGIKSINTGTGLWAEIKTEAIGDVINHYLNVGKKNNGSTHSITFSPTLEDGVTSYVYEFDYRFNSANNMRDYGMIILKANAGHTYVSFNKNTGKNTTATSSVSATIANTNKYGAGNECSYVTLYDTRMNKGEWHTIRYELVYDVTKTTTAIQYAKGSLDDNGNARPEDVKQNVNYWEVKVYVDNVYRTSYVIAENAADGITAPTIIWETRYGDNANPNLCCDMDMDFDNYMLYAAHECNTDASVQAEAYLKEASDCVNEKKPVYYKSCTVCGMQAQDETATFVGDYIHNYEEQFIEGVDSLKTAATCAEQAIYYTVCDCGVINENETFHYGELLPHSNHVLNPHPAALITNANGSSPATYYKTCGECGNVDKETYFVYGKAEAYHKNNSKVLSPGFSLAHFSNNAVNGTSVTISERVTSDVIAGVVNYFIRAEKKNTTTSNVAWFSTEYVEGVDTYYYEFDFRWGGTTRQATIESMMIKFMNDTTNVADTNRIKHYATANSATTLTDTADTDDLVLVKQSCPVGEWVRIKWVITEGADRMWTASCYVNGEFDGSCSGTINGDGKVPAVLFTTRWGQYDLHYDFDNVLCYPEHSCNDSEAIVGEAYRVPGEINKYYKACSVCGVNSENTFDTDVNDHIHEFTREEIISLDGKEINLYSAATCTAKGLYFKLCDHCDAVSSEYCEEISPDLVFETEMLPHNYQKILDGAFLKDAGDCTTNKYPVYYFSCVDCGFKHSDDVCNGGCVGHTAFFEHDQLIHGEFVEDESFTHLASAATCTANATYYKVCNKCSLPHATEVFEKAGTAYGHDMADATCEAPKTCKNGCGYTEGEALGHDYKDTVLDGDLNLAAAATYTDEAKYYKVCQTCGKYSSETFDYGDVLKVYVTFDADDGVFAPDDPTAISDVKVGDILDLPVPILENYVFLGWYYGDTMVAFKGCPVSWKTEAPEVELVAKWGIANDNAFSVNNGNIGSVGTTDFAFNGFNSGAANPAGTVYTFSATMKYDGISAFWYNSGDGTEGNPLKPYKALKPHYIRWYGLSSGAILDGPNSAVCGDLVDINGEVVATTTDGTNYYLKPEYLNEDGSAKISKDQIYFSQFKFTTDYGIVMDKGVEYEIRISVILNESGIPTLFVEAYGDDESTQIYSRSFGVNANSISKFRWELRSAANAGGTHNKIGEDGKVVVGADGKNVQENNVPSFSNRFSFTNVKTSKYDLANKVTVDLDVNYGSLSDDATTEWQVYPNTPMVYGDLPTPTAPEGYEFLGWFDGDTLVDNVNGHSVKGETTLVAKWTKTYVKDGFGNKTGGFDYSVDGYIPTASEVAGTKLIFETDYIYGGVSSFEISADGIVTERTNARNSAYAYMGFYHSNDAGKRVAFSQLVISPNAEWVDAQGNPVVDKETGKLLSPYLEQFDAGTFTGKDIYFSHASWYGCTFKIGETYHLVIDLTLGTNSVAGTSRMTATADGFEPQTGSYNLGDGKGKTSQGFSFYWRGSGTSTGIPSYTKKHTMDNSKLTVVRPVLPVNVSFDSVGGNAIDSTKAMFGSSYQLAEPEKDGHIFLGWYFGNVKIESVGDSWIFNTDVTLTAKWRNAYTDVSFDTAGGEALEVERYEVGKSYVLPPPTRENYTFMGWYDENGNLFTSGDEWTLESFNFKLIAKWRSSWTKVSFNTGLHDTAIDPTIYNYNVAYTLPVLTLDGYRLVGWYDKDGNGYIDTDAWTYDGFDLELTAKWAKVEVGTTNNFDNGTIVNGNVAGADYSTGALLNNKGTTYNDFYFSAGNVGTYYKAEAGSKFVFEAKFTYLGGTAGINDKGVSYIGFVTTSGARSERKMAAFSTMTAAGNGGTEDYEYVTMFGQKYYKDVEYVIRYEYVVGAGTKVNVYTNGQLIGTVSASKGSECTTTDQFESFALYVRRSVSLRFDDVFVGIETEPEKVTLSLDPDMGTLPENVTSNWEVYPGAPMSYDLPTPTLEGYTFFGWYDGDTKVESGMKYAISADTTLVAKWATEKINDTYADQPDRTSGPYYELDTSANSSKKDAAGTTYVFSTKYVYNGLTSFAITDGVVGALNSSNATYSYFKLTNESSDKKRVAYTGVTAGGRFVNALGVPVTDASGELLEEFKDLSADKIYFETLTWGGFSFVIGEKYDIQIIVVMNGGDQKGASSVKMIVTDSDGVSETVSGFTRDSLINTLNQFRIDNRGVGTNTGLKAYTLKHSFYETSFKVTEPVSKANITLDPGMDGVEGELPTWSAYPNVPFDCQLPDLSLDGYVFLGWYNGDTKVESSESFILSGDLALTAKWNTDHTDVSFDAVLEDVTVESKTINYNEENWTLPTPTKEGYEFVGWYNGEELFGATGEAWTFNSFELTLTARWNKIETNKFDTDKVEQTNKSVTYSINSGSVDPIGTKYTFSMRYRYDGLTSFEIVEGADGTKTVKRIKTDHFGFVRFCPTATLNDKQIILDGYFYGRGNYVDANGNIVAELSSDGKTYILTDDSITDGKKIFFSSVEWYGYTFERGKLYDVVFEIVMNGVGNVPTIKMTVTDEAGNTTEKTMTASGSASKTSASVGSLTFQNRSGTYTLTHSFLNVNYQIASPVVKNTITLSTEDGSTLPEGAAESLNVYSTGTVPALPIPVRDNYTFLGWYNGATLVNEGDEWSSISGATLIAKWHASYTEIIFDAVLEDVTVESKTINYNEENWTLPTPTKEGYEFIGWYNGEELFASSGDLWTLDSLDLELTAKWYVVGASSTTDFEGATITNNGAATIGSVTTSSAKTDDTTTSGTWECLREETLEDETTNDYLHVQNTDNSSNHVRVKTTDDSAYEILTINFRLRINSAQVGVTSDQTMLFIKFLNAGGSDISNGTGSTYAHSLEVNSAGTSVGCFAADAEWHDISIVITKSKTTEGLWVSVIYVDGVSKATCNVGDKAGYTADVVSGIHFESRYKYSLSMDIDDVTVKTTTEYVAPVEGGEAEAD